MMNFLYLCRRHSFCFDKHRLSDIEIWAEFDEFFPCYFFHAFSSLLFIYFFLFLLYCSLKCVISIWNIDDFNVIRVVNRFSARKCDTVAVSWTGFVTIAAAEKQIESTAENAKWILYLSLKWSLLISQYNHIFVFFFAFYK